MDVREQLRTAAPDPAPSVDDARQVYRRGRRRVVRRRAVGVGTAVAALLVAIVVAPPFGTPDAPIVDDVVAPPASPPTEPDDDPTAPSTSPETVQVGDVVLTVPDGVTLERGGSGPEPCYLVEAVPTLFVLDAITPEPPAECPAASSDVTALAAAPASAVPPALHPGHADVDGAQDLSEVELLGTDGVRERWERADGTPAETYLFDELDLFLTVVNPDDDPGIVEQLLDTATRAGAAGDDADGEAAPADTERGGAPPLDDEASTEDRAAPPDGPNDLELVDVRVGTHDGFDRVTFEFAGDGQVGWFVGYVEEAREQGSGHEVDVAGSAVLSVAVNMLAFPLDLPDTAVDWNATTLPAPPGAGVLTEVVGSIWYEGQQELFLGLEETTPYRLVRYDDPQLLVIDLLHP